MIVPHLEQVEMSRLDRKRDLNQCKITIVSKESIVSKEFQPFEERNEANNHMKDETRKLAVRGPLDEGSPL